MGEYEVKGITTSIRFTSRASVKIGDSFYTLEACEERMIPDIDGVNIAEERRILWDVVNNEVDEQIRDIVSALKKH